MKTGRNQPERSMAATAPKAASGAAFLPTSPPAAVASLPKTEQQCLRPAATAATSCVRAALQGGAAQKAARRGWKAENVQRRSGRIILMPRQFLCKKIC